MIYELRVVVVHGYREMVYEEHSGYCIDGLTSMKFCMMTLGTCRNAEILQRYRFIN